MGKYCFLLPVMKVVLQYTQEVAFPFTEERLEQIAFSTLEKSGKTFSAKIIALNAIAVSMERIRELNRRYRGKDTVTDILSFGEYSGSGTAPENKRGEIFLGEIFFCPDFIKQSAAEDNISFEHEMAYVFSHSVLHLIGFDHSDEMFTIQDKVVEEHVIYQTKKWNSSQKVSFMH